MPPRFSPKQCHPSVRRHHADLRILGATPLFVFQDGATRQFADVSLPNVRCHPPVPEWCHPSVRSTSTYQDRATRRFVSGRDGEGAQNIEPKTVPPASPEGPTGATRRFVTPVRLRQIRPGSPKQCHPAFRVPRWCHPSVCPRQFAERSVPPPNLGGGSGVVAPGLSAQNCSRSPALIDSNSSPTAAGCAGLVTRNGKLLA